MTIRSGKVKTLQREVIGLIPAGGRATRIAPLPCSKELYPVGFGVREGESEKRPKVACQYLLEKMQHAGITKAYIILKNGKWDIPAYLQDGSDLGMYLAYLVMGVPFGVPFTLDQAYRFVCHATVALGFPDILFQPDDVFQQLLGRQSINDADVILGIFPADRPHKVDIVDLNEDGRIRQIIIKPRETQLRYTWGAAVWTPVFTQFLHEYVRIRKTLGNTHPEMSVGDVIQAAVEDDLRIEGIHISKDPYLDIGTPEDLIRAVQIYAAR